MTDAELEAKYEGLAEGVLPPAQAQKVMELCRQVETLPDASVLIQEAVAL